MKILGLALIFITQNAMAQWSSDPIVANFKLEEYKNSSKDQERKKAEARAAEELLATFNNEIRLAIHNISQPQECTSCFVTTNQILLAGKDPGAVHYGIQRIPKQQVDAANPPEDLTPLGEKQIRWTLGDGTEMSAKKSNHFARKAYTVNIGLLGKDSDDFGRRLDFSVSCGKEVWNSTSMRSSNKDCRSGLTFTQRLGY